LQYDSFQSGFWAGTLGSCSYSKWWNFDYSSTRNLRNNTAFDDGCATGAGCCAAVTRASPLTFADCASARRFICQTPINQNRTVTYLTDFWKTVSS
jgi:hypothetical protein